jgi:glutamate synthase (ferredoxin)
MGPDVAVRKVREQEHHLEQTLDVTTLIPACAPALERGEPVELDLPIRNVNRTVGTILGSELTRRHGGNGLADDTIKLHFTGSAGQSFGAFVPRGITLTLEGDSNDYVGKGLSGGKIIVYPPRTATFVPEENVLIGNVALYGATGGRAFFRGRAGERFCVRNSGAHAVVEGTGDHCCEYMTGGAAVIIGRTGRNFAAGMSGGVAFVLDEAGDFRRRCNLEMVDLEPLRERDDIELVRDLLIQHAGYTGSTVAARLLSDWDEAVGNFVKIMPLDYRRVLQERKKAEQEVREAAEQMEVTHG